MINKDLYSLAVDFSIIDEKTKEILALIEVKNKDFNEYEVKKIKSNFKKVLLDNEVRCGILVFPKETFVIIDTYRTFDEKAFDEYKLETKKLLEKIHQEKTHLKNPLEFAVREWLYKFMDDWYNIVPKDYIEFFVPEFLGQTANGKISEHYKVIKPKYLQNIK